MRLSYIKNGESLSLDESACVGCGACLEVCPHLVFGLSEGRARIIDRGACMECGACALNCPASALSVDKGVGCAAAIIIGKLRGGPPRCGETAGDCGCSESGSGCC